MCLNVDFQAVCMSVEADRHNPKRTIFGEEAAEESFKECAECRRNSAECQCLVSGVDLEAK